MAYGLQVITADGRDLVALLTPIYILDNITTASGTKTYSVPSGKTLKVMKGSVQIGTSGTDQQATTSINGSTLTWSNADVSRNIIVYAG